MLYHTGIVVNKIRKITDKYIDDAIAASQLSMIHYKTKQPHQYRLSKAGVGKLKQLKLESRVVFHKYGSQYLFGKRKPMYEKSFIRLINQDLKNTWIPYPYDFESLKKNNRATCS